MLKSECHNVSVASEVRLHGCYRIGFKSLGMKCRWTKKPPRALYSWILVDGRAATVLMGGYSLFLHVCVFLCTWASTGAPPHSHTQKLSVRSFFWKQRRKQPCFVIGSKKCPAEWIKEMPPHHIGDKNRDAHTQSNARKRSKGNFKFQYLHCIR